MLPPPSLVFVKSTLDAVRLVDYDPVHIIEAVFINIGQVCFLQSVVGGLIIWVGIGMCSRISLGVLLLGSICSVFTAMGLGVASATVYSGLAGYNSCLTAIAIGGFFLVMSRKVAMLVVFASMLTTISTCAIKSLLLPCDMPPLTFPFSLVTWIFVLSVRDMRDVVVVPFSSLTTAEEHLSLPLSPHSAPQ